MSKGVRFTHNSEEALHCVVVVFHCVVLHCVALCCCCIVLLLSNENSSGFKLLVSEFAQKYPNNLSGTCNEIVLFLAILVMRF